VKLLSILCQANVPLYNATIFTRMITFYSIVHTSTNASYARFKGVSREKNGITPDIIKIYGVIINKVWPGATYGCPFKSIMCTGL